MLPPFEPPIAGGARTPRWARPCACSRPDERRDQPDVAPVRGVHHGAVHHDSQPRGQQRGGADAVGVPPLDHVASGEEQRAQQDAEQRQQPDQPLLRHRAHVDAVRGKLICVARRDDADRLELARADADRFLERQLQSGALREEALAVVALERGALLEEAERAGGRDHGEGDHSHDGDREQREERPAAAAPPHGEDREQDDHADHRARPRGAGVGEQDPQDQHDEDEALRERAHAKQPRVDQLLEQDQRRGDEERPVDVRVLEQRLRPQAVRGGEGGAARDGEEQREGGDGGVHERGGDVHAHEHPAFPGGVDVAGEPDAEGEQVERDPHVEEARGRGRRPPRPRRCSA